MIQYLIELGHDWLAARDLFRFVRVFTYVEFRAIIAILFSFTLVVVLAPTLIRWLIRQKIGDKPEFHHADLNQLTKDKTNTPTMGGVLIIGAILASTALLADLSSFYVRMAIVCVVWLVILGAIDDWLKLTAAKRKAGSRQGLYSWEKFVFQLGLAVLLGLFIHHYGESKYTGAESDLLQMSRSLTLPFMRAWETVDGIKVPSERMIVLGAFPFVLITILVIAGSSNAVNLTDGQDGLVSGIMCVIGLAFMVLCLIAGDETWAKYLLVPYIPLSGELAVMCGAMVGACLGFLWYNCHPANVFMGDTGSLPLGGLIGYIAVVTRQEFLLLIIGGILVLETVSVFLQVGYFKWSGGKRIFLCAPIHHHYHRKGWAEQKVVIRFWIVTAVLASLALATIRLR